MATTEKIASWYGIRTLAALRQAVVEAEREALDLPGHFTADEIYLNSGGVEGVNLLIHQNTLSDGSVTYDVELAPTLPLNAIAAA